MIKNEIKKYKALLAEVPALTLTLFVLSTILMNLLANKCIFAYGEWLAIDGGILVAWLCFMTGDMITQRFGAKAAIRMNVLCAAISVFTSLIFALVAAIPSGNGEDFSAIDSILGQNWFIILGSVTAFILGTCINALINAAIGRLFKKNPDGKLAYVTRSYISTFIGQFIDNAVFAGIVFMIFAPMYWGWGYTWKQMIGCSLIGAVAELISQVIFSPIGYKVVMSWKAHGVGNQYLSTFGLEA